VETNYTSTYSYDGIGALSSVQINDGRPRTVTFTTDLNGLILQRDENDNQSTGGDPRELYYNFNGSRLGDVSNNGTSDVDYVTSINRHTLQPGVGAFEGGSWSATPYADFDQSYDPVNGLNYEGVSGRYIVRDGDTLVGIALAVWGDGALWYKIAEANGLSGDHQLAAGMSLRRRDCHRRARVEPKSALGVQTGPKSRFAGILRGRGARLNKNGGTRH